MYSTMNNTSEDLTEVIVLTCEPSTSFASSSHAEYVSWNSNNTKVLIDLYKKYKSRVGTLQIKNLKKLWELIAGELNETMKSNLQPLNCENRWRVLERAYKKYIDNKNKTGRGRKYFEYAEEMDVVFQKKRNIYPEILLSTETLSHIQIATSLTDTNLSEEEVAETPKAAETASCLKQINKNKKKVVINRTSILEQMRKDRVEYQKERLRIEQEKLEIETKKVRTMEVRNKLIEERNQILQEQNKIQRAK